MDEGLVNLGIVEGMTITFHQTGDKPQLHRSGNNTKELQAPGWSEAFLKIIRHGDFDEEI